MDQINDLHSKLNIAREEVKAAPKFPNSQNIASEIQRALNLFSTLIEVSTCASDFSAFVVVANKTLAVVDESLQPLKKQRVELDDKLNEALQDHNFDAIKKIYEERSALSECTHWRSIDGKKDEKNRNLEAFRDCVKHFFEHACTVGEVEDVIFVLKRGLTRDHYSLFDLYKEPCEPVLNCTHTHFETGLTLAVQHRQLFAVAAILCYVPQNLLEIPSVYAIFKPHHALAFKQKCRELLPLFEQFFNPSRVSTRQLTFYLECEKIMTVEEFVKTDEELRDTTGEIALLRKELAETQRKLNELSLDTN